jgi:molybdopterin molybdotransferase
MDGYAVRTQDLVRETNRLSLQGESHAGDSTPAPLYPGTAIRVSTGAPMPQGADRVILRELAHVEGDEVIVPRAGRKSHIRPRASDFACGAPCSSPAPRSTRAPWSFWAPPMSIPCPSGAVRASMS